MLIQIEMIENVIKGIDLVESTLLGRLVIVILLPKKGVEEMECMSCSLKDLSWLKPTLQI